MSRSDFMVGQKVYLKTISHFRDCWKKEHIVEATVTKIGRRYISVRTGDKPYQGWEYKFDMQNDLRQKTDYAMEYVLYPTKQAIHDYWQSAYLLVEIEKSLRKHEYKVGLRTLKEIATALNIPLDYKKTEEHA